MKTSAVFKSLLLLSATVTDFYVLCEQIIYLIFLLNRLECEVGASKERAERKSKEKRKLGKEVVRLRRELADMYKNNERGIRYIKHAI